MSPQLYQSIKLMALPIVDLREKIEEEIEKNPALEILEDRSTISLDSALSSPRKEEDDYFEATSDSGFIRRGGDEAAEEQHRFIEGALSRSETLQEHLLWQLRLEPVEPAVRETAELIIQNLNADGFHTEPVELLLKDRPPEDRSPEKIARTLSLVQSLDPQGCGCADYRESLLVQAGLLPDAPGGMAEALAYLELLEKGSFREAARKLSRTEEEVRAIFERLRKLSPFPGRQFDSGDTRYVVPDIQIIRQDGEFVIILNDEEIPVLGINPFFMKLSDEKDGERAARDFVRENIKEARWFIHSINRRNHTLVRVTRAIVEFQRPFFAGGPKYLAPLTLRNIVHELGLNESTVSRIANGKYVQTEWGIFEIRHFFSSAVRGSAGSSKEGVKEIIREILSGENRRMADQEIAGELARRGVSLARRTVAKYRKELDLGSSYDR
jgi:RNA polymerase sigma-54 factor